jgi:hypothetical protein
MNTRIVMTADTVAQHDRLRTSALHADHFLDYENHRRDGR